MIVEDDGNDEESLIFHAHYLLHDGGKDRVSGRGTFFLLLFILSLYPLWSDAMGTLVRCSVTFLFI